MDCKECRLCKRSVPVREDGHRRYYCTVVHDFVQGLCVVRKTEQMFDRSSENRTSVWPVF